MFIIRYKGLLAGTIERRFASRQRAQQWCRQIGRPGLIDNIEEVTT